MTTKHGDNRPDPMADVHFRRECGPEVGQRDCPTCGLTLKAGQDTCPRCFQTQNTPIIPKVRPMMRHELKCWRKAFDLSVSGEKFWEVRKDDRDYRVADEILLREYSPLSNFYTGREALFSIVAVGNMSDLPASLFPDGVWPKVRTVILSLAPLELYPWGQSLSDPRD